MIRKPDRSLAAARSHDFVLAAIAGLALGSAWRSDGPAPLALVFVVCLITSLRDAAAGRRAVLAWLAGSLAAGLGAGEATAEGLSAYFRLRGFPLLLAWLAAHQLLGALPFAVFGLLVGRIGRRSALLGFIDVAAAWVVSEWVRALLFPGPWLSLASALAPWPAAIQMASWWGAQGVSFWLAGVGYLIQRALAGPDRRPTMGVLGAILALLLAQSTVSLAPSRSLGRIRISETQSETPSALEVALVQSGADARERPERPDDAEALDRLIAISAPQTHDADLVVWPEGAVRSVWPANASLLDRARLARLDARHVLLGAPWIERPLSGGTLAVGAVLVEADGAIRGVHRKTRLVPLAETRSEGILGWTSSTMAAYSPAPADPPLAVDSTRLGVSICYEILFDAVVREQVRAGADLLVNLSNESWLGTSGQGQRHMLAAAVLRAVEVRRIVLRATTTGETAAIDARGRIVARLPARGSGVLRLGIDPAKGESLFARLGPWPFAGFCFAWTVGRLFLLRRGTGKTPPGIADGDARRPA